MSIGDGMSETKRASDLPDGFYYVVDSRYPGQEDIMARVDGTSWRIGDSVSDGAWSDTVSFYPVPPRSADKANAPPIAGKIVGMVAFKDHLFVASENGVYEVTEDDVLRPLRFSEEPSSHEMRREAIETEREECAKVCEAGINNAEDWDSTQWDQACENRACAIRMRSNAFTGSR